MHLHFKKHPKKCFFFNTFSEHWFFYFSFSGRQYHPGGKLKRDGYDSKSTNTNKFTIQRKIL